MANRAIGEAIQANIEAVGNPKWSAEEQAFARKFQAAVGVPEVGLHETPTPFGTRPQSASSNDNGDVTWVVPTGAMAFPASVPGIQYHNWQAGVTPTMSLAHKGTVAGAKVMAASLIDLLTSAELREKARTEFAGETARTKYFSLLPAETRPPVDLNREMMERYRQAMQKFYLNKTVQLN